MRRLTRGLLLLLLSLAAVRAVEFLLCAFYRAQFPLDTFNLEAKMVHLAWRVQHGIPLYPEWRTYPHVTNVFGPVYFLLVGGIGRAVGASIEGLYAIGRGVTLVSVLLTTLLIGGLLARRCGLAAGLFGAFLSLGNAPLDGFGMMVRSDVLAELLGFGGFTLALRHRAGWAWLSGLVLALAALTKQTAGSYLIASVLALWVEGRRTRVLGLAVGTAALLVGTVVLVQLFVEPNFLDGLLAAGYSPWNVAGWAHTVGRLLRIGLELPLLAVTGLVLWNTGGRRERSWTALAGVQLVVSTAGALKYGADLNYFLGLGIVAALAGGTFWNATWRIECGPAPGQVALALAVGVLLAGAGVVALLWSQLPNPGGWSVGLGIALTVLIGALWALARRTGTRAWVSRVLVAELLAVVLALEGIGWLLQLDRSMASYEVFRSPGGRQTLQAFTTLFQIAENPARRILTDSGEIDIRQGERTVFGDPWLFRLYTERGHIDVSRLEAMIDRQEFELIVTRHDLFADDYETYDFGLPKRLAERARARYEPVGSLGSLFFYQPRRPAAGGDP